MKYYLFWIQSSRGTNATTVRAFETEQSKERLKSLVEAWCEGFGAWHISENSVSYGSRLLTRLPKNRKDCLAKHAKACERAAKYTKQQSLYASLLSLPPFNGGRVQSPKGAKK